MLTKILIVLLIIAILLYFGISKYRVLEFMECGSPQQSLIHKINNNSMEIYNNADNISGLYRVVDNKKRKPTERKNALPGNKPGNKPAIIARINYNSKRIYTNEQDILGLRGKLKQSDLESLQNRNVELNVNSNDEDLRIKVDDNCRRINKNSKTIAGFTDRINSAINTASTKTLKAMESVHVSLSDTDGESADELTKLGDIYANPDDESVGSSGASSSLHSPSGGSRNARKRGQSSDCGSACDSPSIKLKEIGCGYRW